ncbi:thermonuclease family protein [Candidatus Pacearchaeota archaeon]|nr:thermonuclease family protein [Candidatus Pacearchaeota archaeon]
MNSEKRKQIFLLIGLVVLLFIINYSFLDKLVEEFLVDYETGFVERAIDGDTIVINGSSVRLLGINTPEKGEIYYEEAKEFLEELILNKEVRIEKIGKDKYYRDLAYIFINGKNVNLKLVDEGFANFYFPSGKDMYYDKFVGAWKNCIKNNKNLCEKSNDECVDCIKLKEFNYKNQIILLYNACDFNCELTNWTIKDEGRKKFIFPKFVLEKRKEIMVNVGEGINNKENLFWKNEDYVWTKTGDTLFLRDLEGKLVLWRSY